MTLNSAPEFDVDNRHGLLAFLGCSPENAINLTEARRGRRVLIFAATCVNRAGMGDFIKIVANGRPYTIAPQTPLPAFLREQGLRADCVIVERNGTALTRSEADAAVLANGDSLEIVRLVAGG